VSEIDLKRIAPATHFKFLELRRTLFHGWILHTIAGDWARLCWRASVFDS
jgi:hypothetical protein